MYCTTQNIIDRFGEDELIQLTDEADSTGQFSNSINATQVQRAIEDSTATIDSYLASRYPLPLVNVPPVLERFACDLARYFLHDRSPLEEVTHRYKEAIRYLEKVAKGDISLGIDSDGARPETKNDAVIQSGGSVFNRSDKSFI